MSGHVGWIHSTWVFCIRVLFSPLSAECLCYPAQALYIIWYNKHHELEVIFVICKNLDIGEAVTSAIPLIKHFEGFRETAYKCPSGVWTVGYGSTYILKGGNTDTLDKQELRPVVEGDKVTKAYAEINLFTRVYRLAQDILQHLKKCLNDNQLAAMLCLIDNIGMSAFLKSKCFAHFNEGDIDSCLKEWDWVYAGGKKLRGLEIRREKERQLFNREMPKRIRDRRRTHD